METTHRLFNNDARDLSFIKDESLHLVVTSPPYWNIKKYNDNPSQLGHVDDYEAFHLELESVWRECFRVLVKGGRLVIIIGDACKSRRDFGRHVVFPNHCDITVNCRKIGFDNLNPIIWYKISNANLESDRSSSFLGKPFEPNAIIKNDMEFILMQRKPGDYRHPTETQREKSKIDKEEFKEWFRQIWEIPGARGNGHPAPFPFEVPKRLVRMFSFFGDTVLDPFCGTGTTLIAAMKAHRNSIGIEIDQEYYSMAKSNLVKNSPNLWFKNKIICS